MNTLLPEIIAQRDDGADRLTLTLRIQPELDYFVGHFPELPLLPGVVQVDWAVRFGRELLQARGDFVSLDNLKFQAMIVPNATVQLALEWQAASGRLNFAYTQGETVMSSGRICLAGEAVA